MKAHGRLDYPKSQNPMAQRYRFGLPPHKFTGHLRPGLPQAALFNPLGKPQILKNSTEQIRWRRHIFLKIEGLSAPTKLTENLSSDYLSAGKPTPPGDSSQSSDSSPMASTGQPSMASRHCSSSS
ncbi:MAG: hypothetical protein VX633_07405, partial [Verrucomicrobiota bacterium]|nr:hypothetical protein [Verrucomicrobiota bacterium]